MKKILVIGSLNVDMVVNVHHIPAVGETILADKMELVPGGKGANQAYAAGRLGADVVMFGAVGDDRYAEIEKKQFTVCRCRYVAFADAQRTQYRFGLDKR